MKITFNNLTTATDIIQLTQLPNILRIEGSEETQFAQMTITIPANITESSATITINDITIASTDILENAVNNVFYLVPSMSSVFLAYSIAKALNNTQLAASYDIYSNERVVYIKAKQPSAQFNISHSVEGLTLSINKTNATNNSVLTNSIVQLVVTDADGNYITTLSKQYTNKSLSFNMSPLLVTLTEYNSITHYNIKITAINGTTITSLGELSNLKVINGYKINEDSANYITIKDRLLLQDITNGDNNSTYINNTTLYYYQGEKLQISVYNKNNTQYSITVTEYNGDEVLLTMNYDITPIEYQTLEFNTYMKNATHTVVNIPTVGNIRYNNITPISYADAKDVKTIYWNNSYGGVSFFTFTHKREDAVTTEKEIINKNVFDYYDNNYNTKQIYSNTTTQTTTLTSHYIDKNALYTLYDLNKAQNAWIIDKNNNVHNVIITSVEVNRINNKQYQATIKYVN